MTWRGPRPMTLLCRIREFLHFVWRENLAGARITVRDAWFLARPWGSRDD